MRMRANLGRTRALVWWLVLASFCGVLARAQAADVKLTSYLVWGTDDPKPPPGKNYKPVEPDIQKRLTPLLKWKYYFEVSRTNIVLAPQASKKVALSEKCELDIKNADAAGLDVLLIGKGKEVARQKQVLPKGDILILGGNAPNATAWFVILKRIE